MTISAAPRKAGPYLCDGIVVAFPFAFKVFSAADLVVTYTSTDKIEMIAALDFNYSVSLNEDQENNPGGSVITIFVQNDFTVNSPLPAGAILTITSGIPATQNLELTSGGGFYPGVINAALDRITMIVQQVMERLSRAVVIPVSSSSSPDDLIARLEAIAAAMEEYPAGVTPPDLTSQAHTAFTTAGVAGALTLAPTIPLTAYIAGMRYRVKFSAASTGADTLNISARGAKALKQYDATGEKIPAVFALGTLADVEYDGTDMLLIDQLPPASIALAPSPIRQAVTAGPITSTGAANLGGATGNTWISCSGVSASYPLIVTAAAGWSAVNGLPIDIRGITTAPISWIGLTTNGTMYLYVNVSESGVISTGSTTIPPVYQDGGASSTIASAHTYNIKEGVMRVGTGGSSTPVTRVFIGEVTVASGVVADITWYAYNGAYAGAWTAILPAANSLTTVTHALGLIPLDWALEARCDTTDLTFSVGEIVQNLYGLNAANDKTNGVAMIFTRKTARFNAPASTSATWMVQEGSVLTRTRWSYRVTASRGW